MPADKNFCQFLEVLTCRNHLGEIGSDWARHSKDPWAGYYTQFSLWVFLNRILSQAQTATQKLFWHNSVWIWQSIWKCLSESPHPKCNYHRICCEAVCDEQAASPVLVPRSLPPILILSSGSSFSRSLAGHHTQPVRSYASTCSKCWPLAEAETRGPVAASQTSVSLQEQRKNGSKAIHDGVCARNSQKMFS